MSQAVADDDFEFLLTGSFSNPSTQIANAEDEDALVAAILAESSDIEEDIASSVFPTVVPTIVPSVAPSAVPSVAPIAVPTVVPIAVPAVVPIAVPNVAPIAVPAVVPIAVPNVVVDETPIEQTVPIVKEDTSDKPNSQTSPHKKKKKKKSPTIVLTTDTIPSPTNSNGAVFNYLTKSIKSDDTVSPFSLEDEDQVLQAIIGAMQEQQSSVSTDLDADTFDVEMVLDHAERIAATTNGDVDGTSVLHSHENHALKEELKRAKASAGWPSCVDSCSFYMNGRSSEKNPCVSVGTTLGLILLFSFKNKLCGVCGSTVNSAGESKGTTTSISFARDGKQVVGGYERGAVILWSTETLQALKSFDDTKSPVLRCSFFHPDPHKFIFMDSDNIIRICTSGKMMGNLVFRTSSIYTGYMSPCNDIATTQDPKSLAKGNEVHYIATICSETLSIFAVSFGIQIATSLNYSSQNPHPTSYSNELVCFVNGAEHQILCACWTTTLEILRVLTDSSGNISLQVTNRLDLTKPVINFVPLDGPCAMFVDQEDRAFIIDAKIPVIVESVRLLKFDFVSFSSRSTGTKFHGNMSHSGGDVVLLGQSRVMFCTLLSWEERLDALISLKKWNEAFTLAKDLSLEIAVAVVGFSLGSKIRRDDIMNRTVQLITAFISDTVRRKPSPQTWLMEIKKIMAFCSEIDSIHLFFKNVMEFLKNVQVGDIALYALEEGLLDGSLSSIPDLYVRSFVELYQSPTRFAAVNMKKDCRKSPMERVETALMNIPDNFSMLISIAQELKMFRLECTILSFRKHDHVGALKAVLEPCPLVALEYLEALFASTSLISGKDIVPTYRKQAKENVLLFLIQTPKALSTLLKSDCTRAINAIGENFKDVDSDLYGPMSESSPVSRKDIFVALQAQLIDASISYAHPWKTEERKWPPYSCVIQFYLLFCPEVACGRIVVSDDFVARATFNCAYSFQKVNIDKRKAIQRALCQLLTSASGQSSLHLVESELQSKRLVRVSSAISASRGDYISAIKFYLYPQSMEFDPDIQRDVFHFIASEMKKCISNKDLKGEESLRSAVKQSLKNLVKVDPSALAQFVFEYLPNDHREVILALQGSTETFLLYLRGMIGKNDRITNEDKELQNTYIRLLCMHSPDEVYKYLVTQDLEIQYDIREALNSCRAHNVTDASIFLLEKTMQISDAMELLMTSITKKMNDLRLSVVQRRDEYRVAEKELSTKVNVESTVDYKIISPEDSNLLNMVNIGIDLCTRYQEKLSMDQLGELWFQLLDRFAKPKRLIFERNIRKRQGTSSGIDENEIELTCRSDPICGSSLPPLSVEGHDFTAIMLSLYTKYSSYILSKMVKSLPLSTVVGKIVMDNEQDKFGPFKPIIVGILESLSFDLEINRLCTKCAEADTIKLGNELKGLLCCGIIPKSEFCCYCSQHLTEVVGGFDSIRFYLCGHGYHEECCDKMYECGVCFGGLEEFKNQIKQKSPKKREQGTNQNDTNYILRRLRQCKSRLDGGKNYREMLETLCTGSSELSQSSTQNLLLSPAPQPPFSISNFCIGELPDEAENVEELNDDDLIRIFGENGILIKDELEGENDANYLNEEKFVFNY